MAVINTGLLTRGLRSEFFNRYEAMPTIWQDLALRIPSTGDSENYKWLGTVPRMREWGTGRLAKGLRSESYSVENEKYEVTIEADRDEISDDQTGQIRIRVGELAQAAAVHKEYLLSQLMINGATAGWNSYDGVPFFAATHASGASGNQDNDLTASAVNTSLPTSVEFRAALQAAIAAMMMFKDDQGEPMPMRPSGLICVVPWSMYWAALEATGAAMLNNSTNVMAQMAPRVVSLPYLTTATTWYLLKTDGIIRPFIFQDREPVEFGSLAEDSDEGFKREKLLFGVRARYKMTYGYWQYAVRTVFQ